MAVAEWQTGRQRARVPLGVGAVLEPPGVPVVASAGLRACADGTGVERARPYDLRHGFASLLLHEGRSVIYVARQLGHDARLTLTVYGHVIDELDGTPQSDAARTIQSAREACVRLSFAPAQAAAT
jgi:integrase